MGRLIVTAGARALFDHADKKSYIAVYVSVSEAESGKPVTDLERSDFKVRMAMHEPGPPDLPTPVVLPYQMPGFYQMAIVREGGLSFGSPLLIKVTAGKAPTTPSRVPGSGGLKVSEPLHTGQVIVPILMEPGASATP